MRKKKLTREKENIGAVVAQSQMILTQRIRAVHQISHNGRTLIMNGIGFPKKAVKKNRRKLSKLLKRYARKYF